MPVKSGIGYSRFLSGRWSASDGGVRHNATLARCIWEQRQPGRIVLSHEDEFRHPEAVSFRRRAIGAAQPDNTSGSPGLGHRPAATCNRPRPAPYRRSGRRGWPLAETRCRIPGDLANALAVRPMIVGGMLQRSGASPCHGRQGYGRHAMARQTGRHQPGRGRAVTGRRDEGATEDAEFLAGEHSRPRLYFKVLENSAL